MFKTTLSSNPWRSLLATNPPITLLSVLSRPPTYCSQLLRILSNKFKFLEAHLLEIILFTNSRRSRRRQRQITPFLLHRLGPLPAFLRVFVS
ncbi:hypothetical protein BDQ12DRAFT_688352 [Crucibulum laeve]|uniref:Uncharacterized protein n=1 Tax=Crucibulum laeve TaxID=68775 RepID=A0A5C3LR61_9AGAR|nr:hypothetical protein BDQ12DRAFT_688352 [Crucibulum laeve]